MRALATVFVLVLTAIAQAQTPDPEGARLFEEGRVLAKEGKWEQACDKFQKSLAIDPAIGTQLNYADCHEKLDQNAAAWRLFDGAADAEKMINPERAKFSRSRADALLAKLGVVVLKIATPDAPMLEVTIAGRTVKGAAVVSEIVDPGDIAISVTAANAPPFQKTEKVVAGKTVTVEVPPFPGVPVTGGDGGSVGITTPPPSETPTTGERRRSRVLLAYGVGGAGAVALVAGVVIGLKARSDYNAQLDGAAANCIEVDGESRPICNANGFAALTNAVSLANAGTVFGVAGIALIGAGAVLFLTAPRDMVVTPMATAQSAGISVVGRF